MFNSIAKRFSVLGRDLYFLKYSSISTAPNSDVVIALFRDNGFSDTQISKITGTLPELLRYSAHKTLKPKFNYLKSQGFTGSDFTQILCIHPYLLTASLKKNIVPKFEFMRSIVHTDAKLITLLKRSSRILALDPETQLIPNIMLLQAHAVPAHNIAKFLIAQPRSFMKPFSRFREILQEVTNMKFHPQQYVFLEAVRAFASLTRSSLESKFDVYRRWGLTEEELQFMFRKHPQSVMISEKKIMSTMNFFVKEMGYTPSSIAKQPIVLCFSLKRRIIPRCSVIQLLTGKGLIGNIHSLTTMLVLPEETFLKRFVTKFEKEIPELLSAYLRKQR